MAEKVVLGIDIGGTNTAFGLIGQKSDILFQESIPTESKKPADDLFRRLFSKIKEVREIKNGELQIAGVGIGVPNGNYYSGMVENPPNLSWGDVNLIDLVQQEINLPVVVTNDANAAALGEMYYGIAKNMKDFLLITLGTGLGSGIVVNGRVVYGHDGYAGEMGHMTAVRDGRSCSCGRRGCLETYASASGLRRTVIDLLMDSSRSSILRTLSDDQLTSKKIYEAAEKGDKLALDAFEFTGKILGRKLADSIAYLSPEAIIFSGGLAEAGDYILKPVRFYMEKNLLTIYKNKVKLLQSGLSAGKSAILGAAALIWNELRQKGEDEES